MKKVVQLAVWVCLFFVSDVSAKLLPMEEFTLDNGLQVIVVTNTKAPVVKQMLWYKVGSIDEPAGKGGAAHLLEHLMFRGTSKVPGSSFNDIIARNGGDSNAFTSTDFTAYHEFVDVSRLEVAMALEADRMVNLNFDDDAFDKERKIVFQERQQRISNNPAAQFAEAVNRILWQNSPYARPVTGTEEEILNLTPEDIRGFYRRYYAPDNAILVLSGDIDRPSAKMLAEKYFGNIKKGNRPQISPEQEKTRLLAGSYQTLHHFEMRHPEIKTPRVIRRYLVPSLKEDSKKAYALMVFSKYLGEGDASFLNRELVLNGKTAAAGSFYDSLSRGAGVFSLSAVPADGRTPEETETLLDNGLKQALSGLTQDDIEREKKKMTAGLVYIRDNPSDAALLVGQMAALGFDWEEIDNYEENIKKVSLADIKEAVSDMLSSSSSITGFLLPAVKEEQ